MKEAGICSRIYCMFATIKSLCLASVTATFSKRMDSDPQPSLKNGAIHEESFVDGFTQQITDVGMHAALIRAEYAMMRTRARLVECVGPCVYTSTPSQNRTSFSLLENLQTGASCSGSPMTM